MLHRLMSAASAVCITVAFTSLAQAQTANASGGDIICQVGGKTIDPENCLRILQERLRSPRSDVDAARARSSEMPRAAGNAGRTDSADRQRATRRALAAAPKKADADKNENPSFRFLLRRSLDDIDSFVSPKDLADSAGAEFSWTYDGITGNRSWAARGVAALSFVWENPEPAFRRGYLSTVTLAPYLVFDRVTNTVDTTKNIDNLVLGFSGELAYSNLWKATHYFRLRSEAVSSFDGAKAKNWAVVGEYQPVGQLEQEGDNTILSYLGTPIGVTRDVFVTISPKLKGEFRSVLEGNGDPIFASRNQVIRTGPTITGAIAVDNLFNKTLPFYSVVYQATYGWLWDWLSNRDYWLFDTSLTFNLTAEGNFGLTLSYRRGQLEETGVPVEITKAGLALKF